jgi:hypothetical protein
LYGNGEKMKMIHDKTVVGICSRCGGDVTLPTIWHGVVPPVPTCEECGAMANLRPNLPIIPTKPAKWKERRWTNSEDLELNYGPTIMNNRANNYT